MKSILAGVFCLLLPLFLFPTPGFSQFLDLECGFPYEKSTNRIKNGSVAHRTPWMALIFSLEGDFICAGTLISPRLVLTAAHCLNYNTKLKATLGEYNKADMDAPREDHQVTFAFRHKLYNEKTQANDIAILRLASYVKYKDHISPVCIVWDKTWRKRIDSFGLLTATGWGITETGLDSGDLMSLDIYRQKPDWCEFYIKSPGPLASNQFCAGNCDSNLCKGDSGGPVGTRMMIGNSMRHIQVGIASFTNKRCERASVFTDDLSHIDFIASVWHTYGTYREYFPLNMN